MQCGGDGKHLFGPLQPISSLELTPEQSRHRVHHQEPDQAPGQQEGDAAGQTHLQGVLQVNKAPPRLLSACKGPTSLIGGQQETLTRSAACSM